MLNAAPEEGQLGSKLLGMGEQEVLIPGQVGVVTQHTQPRQTHTHTSKTLQDRQLGHVCTHNYISTQRV